MIELAWRLATVPAAMREGQQVYLFHTANPIVIPQAPIPYVKSFKVHSKQPGCDETIIVSSMPKTQEQHWQNKAPHDAWGSRHGQGK